MPTPPDAASVRKPLRTLTFPDVGWLTVQWHDSAATSEILVSDGPIHKYFESTKGVTLQCDASDKGLDAVLLQDGHPIAYASRALTRQIKKEHIAVTYGLEKFHTYTYGRQVTVELDHKPLEVIVKKPLHRAPKRLQGMLLRIKAYTKGSKMYLADVLSRAYLP